MKKKRKQNERVKKEWVIKAKEVNEEYILDLDKAWEKRGDALKIGLKKYLEERYKNK